jgi:DNA-binding NarL/FixJ family response regulator
MAVPDVIRIVLAEDHTILREGLRSLLSQPGYEVVGEAGDGLAAIALVRRLKPLVAIMDLSMPKMNGIDAVREISKRHPGTRVIALTVHETEEYVHAALQAGAAGYVLKDASAAELLAAIRTVADGGNYLAPQFRALTRTGGSPGKRPGKRVAWDTVTQREREILKLIAEGHRNREIAELLSISASTVEKHRSNLMAKLDLHNAAAITAFAARKGLIS